MLRIASYARPIFLHACRHSCAYFQLFCTSSSSSVQPAQRSFSSQAFQMFGHKVTMIDRAWCWGHRLDNSMPCSSNRIRSSSWVDSASTWSWLRVMVWYPCSLHSRCRLLTVISEMSPAWGRLMHSSRTSITARIYTSVASGQWRHPFCLLRIIGEPSEAGGSAQACLYARVQSFVILFRFVFHHGTSPVRYLNFDTTLILMVSSLKLGESTSHLRSAAICCFISDMTCCFSAVQSFVKVIRSPSLQGVCAFDRGATQETIRHSSSTWCCQLPLVVLLQNWTLSRQI